MIEDSGGWDGAADGFVRFQVTGERASGAFHCSECRYGITIAGPLPTCPMCGGTSWEAELRPSLRATGEPAEPA